MIHRDIGAMTLLEFVCARAGYIEARGDKKVAPAMSAERLAELEIVGF